MTYIKDEEFLRGNCPMTKEEIRILSIARMDLGEEDRVLDIGAGTGSISIQVSRLCPKGQVVAVEKEEEAIRLINENKKRFCTDNLSIIEGQAPQVLDHIIGSFDSIFIGGSGGNIETIIKESDKKLKNGKVIVLNFITIENLYRALNTLKELNYNTECTQVSVNRVRGKALMLSANNSIFIVSGRKI